MVGEAELARRSADAPVVPLEGRRWRRLARPDGLPSDHVTAVVAVGADLWVGTRGGLIHPPGPA